jgi:transposase
MLLSATGGSFGKARLSTEFRRRVLDLLAAGRRVTDLARDLGVSSQTIYLWRHQEQIDRGLVPGLTSAERTELTAAKRRIRELEAELAIHRRASELLAERSDPKGASRRSR